MAYSTNPHLPKARAIALQLLVREQLPPQVVANRCGVHRSTMWRWKRKWDELNHTQQLLEANHPSRIQGKRRNGMLVSRFRLDSCHWIIPTLSSAPQSHPFAISAEVVALVLAVPARSLVAVPRWCGTTSRGSVSLWRTG